MIPPVLLNCLIRVYVQEHTKGTMSQPQIKIRQLFTAKGRCDLKSVRREGSDAHEMPYQAKVFVNGGADIKPKHWIKVEGKTVSFLGQVVTVSHPGLMAHHVEALVEARPYQPEII